MARRDPSDTRMSERAASTWPKHGRSATSGTLDAAVTTALRACQPSGQHQMMHLRGPTHPPAVAYLANVLGLDGERPHVLGQRLECSLERVNIAAVKAVQLGLEPQDL